MFCRLPFQRRLTRTCRVRASILANPVVGWILRTRGGGGLGSCFERIGISFDIFFVFSFTILRASVTASDGKTEKDNGTEGETQKAEPEKKGGAVEMRWVDTYFPFTELSSLRYIFKEDNAKAVGIPVKELKVFSKIF
ncbi:hypothetical protein HID58_047224 [Brassica napus]|uniref:Uncharacterized protein n=1 Tax=Brassica napus TaxID=3708 RepID=A0ABQ8AYP6_BRANA|nr:hypothetical protein HID58_047224 [Brassica napus]